MPASYTLSMVDAVDAPQVHEPVTKTKASAAGTIIASTLGPMEGILVDAGWTDACGVRPGTNE